MAVLPMFLSGLDNSGIRLGAGFFKDWRCVLGDRVQRRLCRFTSSERSQIELLVFFRDGVNPAVLGAMLGETYGGVPSILNRLEALGMATWEDRFFLRLDPGLIAYLQKQRAPTAVWQRKWVQAMAVYLGYLEDRAVSEPESTARLVSLESANFLTLLELAKRTMAPEKVLSLTVQMEPLIRLLNSPIILARVVQFREQAVGDLPKWNRSIYLQKAEKIETLLNGGHLQAALAEAEFLLQTCLDEGEGAYDEVPFDVARSLYDVGRILGPMEQPFLALGFIHEARWRFEGLAEKGLPGANEMILSCLSQEAERLLALGFPAWSDEVWSAALTRAMVLGDSRGAVLCRFGMAKSCRKQKKYAEALSIFEWVREWFEGQREVAMVASAWHYIGLILMDLGKWSAGERAFDMVLLLRSQTDDHAGEAMALVQLGLFFDRKGDWQQAALFFQRAVDLYHRLENDEAEAFYRNHLAVALLHHHRLAPARRVLKKALQLAEAVGDGAQPWRIWNTLCLVENEAGDYLAARQARDGAMAAYEIFRGRGGTSQSNLYPLIQMVEKALQKNDSAEGVRVLQGILAKKPLPGFLVALLEKLTAVLRGDRDLRLAQDPNLDYGGAVELLLLLKRIDKKSDLT